MVKWILFYKKDLGGFLVSCIIFYVDVRSIGLFVFVDYMGFVYFLVGSGINVRFYLYIGLVIISYLMEGSMLYRDSLGII